jgi:AbrB family looped-hinge helix DNA binding protein
MNQAQNVTTPVQTQEKEEWLRVLGKGMITIPKNWRDEFGLETGKFVKVIKTSGAITIKPVSRPAPYRIYSKKELNKFFEEDLV